MDEFLADDPKSVAKKPAQNVYGYRAGYVYHFDATFSERTHYFAVFFVYGPEVNAITITGVTIQPPWNGH